jgi:hypothetical protein
MKCNKAQEWISLQLDGQLAAQHVPVLQEHLGACADCRVYCDELLMGRRLLAAASAAPLDNFDWKLQLRLNHAMREAAREVRYPWGQPLAGWRRWLARAGVAAAFGLTAVLVVALVAPGRLAMAPDGGTSLAAGAERSPRLPVQPAAAAATPSLTFLDGTRRPLDSAYRTLAGAQGFGLQRQVSGSGGLSWSAGGGRDPHRIRQLEQDLEAMRRHLGARERQIQALEAKLDSLGRLVVDRASGE